MPSITELRIPKASPPPRRDPCAEADMPCCPACGGLECLCRPRFFPGQLLSDTDLNRLQGYVIDKNRLHNRYLHGWGVACGLEVACDPCAAGSVIVRAGYALSPCGDDIVVCNDQSVDVCALIDECRPAREPVCEPPYEQPPRECKDGGKEWVIGVCYDERPARGMTALLGGGDTPCGAGCACGGSSGCGCGAGKGGSSPASAPKARKAYQPQCEPTQICEGYRFVAYRAPDRETPKPPGAQGLRPGTTSQNLLWAWLYANRSRFGPLLERLLCCITRAMELRAAIREGKPLDTAAALATYRDYAEALRDFASDFAVHRCAFVGDVEKEYKLAREYAAAGGVNAADLNERVGRLDLTWLDLVSECFCSALLPACPQPTTSNCVPLAVVTIDRGRCVVEQICNWEERKLLVTWPTIQYWLSWLPWDNLRRTLVSMCCGDDRGRQAYSWLQLMLGVAMLSLRPQAKAGAAAGDAASRAMQADNLMEHALREFDRTRAGEATGAPAWATLAARLADGSAFGPLMGEAVATDSAARDAAVRGDVDSLRAEVAELKGTLDGYRRTLDGLRSLMGRG
jgi:hypothetical protein